jgi:hypothetical protein
VGDIYQGAYDAVYHRISNGNLGQAVESVIREQAGSLSFAIARIEQDAQVAIAEHQRPSVLFRPALSLDGHRWCALYGANLQDGVCGFGESPEQAMRAFDDAWRATVPGPLVNQILDRRPT